MHGNDSHRGFVTIASVIMLLVVAVAAALVVFLVAWQSADAQVMWVRRAQAQGLADACAETARARLWKDAAYSGDESLTFLDGECTIFPLTASASYEVRAESVVRAVTVRTLAEYELTVDASGSVQTLTEIRFSRVAEF